MATSSSWTIALGVIGANAMNLYGGMLSLLTAASSLTCVCARALGLRIAGIAAIFAAALLLSVAASSNFLANYQNFLLLLLYFFIPWTAINLTDFYFVKRGRYDMDALYEPQGATRTTVVGGPSGGVALKAMPAYVVGMLVQLPFANITWWKGWPVDCSPAPTSPGSVGLLVPGRWSATSSPVPAAGRRAVELAGLPVESRRPRNAHDRRDRWHEPSPRRPRILPLQYGAEPISKGLSIRGA